jgi:hypothetical protein
MYFPSSFHTDVSGIIIRPAPEKLACIAARWSRVSCSSSPRGWCATPTRVDGSLCTPPPNRSRIEMARLSLDRALQDLV